jgi:hypothetical protein
MITEHKVQIVNIETQDVIQIMEVVKVLSYQILEAVDIAMTMRKKMDVK